jgi:cell shape-determining protein MreC
VEDLLKERTARDKETALKEQRLAFGMKESSDLKEQIEDLKRENRDLTIDLKQSQKLA